MKYDETSSWGEADDQTDEAEFQDLRKRLQVLQQTIAAIDEVLYLRTLTGVVATTFGNLKANPQGVDWRDLELALHEMFLFGELAIKNGGLYRKGRPLSVASESLVKMLSEMLSCGQCHQGASIKEILMLTRSASRTAPPPCRPEPFHGNMRSIYYIFRTESQIHNSGTGCIHCIDA